jgi:hypothetical protein
MPPENAADVLRALPRIIQAVSRALQCLTAGHPETAHGPE